MNCVYYPKVTIVIPVYNGELFMKYAIDSALNQTYNNIEILVINDGSKDNTDTIAKGYGNKIRYIKKKNGGVSSVLNMAIREMKGEWLSWLSHDDTYFPNKIETQIDFINSEAQRYGIEHKSIIACCANDRIDVNGNHIIRPVKYGRNYPDNIELLIDQIANYTIGGCCVLASRDVYMKLGGFNENNKTCSDAEMWYSMILQGYKFLFNSNVLVHSRQHNKMVSVMKSELCIFEGIVLHEQVAKDIIDKCNDQNTIKKLVFALYKRGYSNIGKQYIDKLNVLDRMTLGIQNTFFMICKVCQGILRKIYRRLFY